MVLADSDVVSPLQPIPADRAGRLLGYLNRVADASLSAPEPNSKFIISHKRNYMHPRKDASVNVLIAQYLNELEGYRTDSHIATWQMHDIKGHTWNAFSYLWQNGAHTLDQLYDALQYNEVPKGVYAQDLQELVNRGWIKNVSGEFSLTDEGRLIREEAEELTDQYFFAPWNCLGQAELEDMYLLVAQLRDGLRNLE
jgi:hypothetical protein